MNRDYEYFRKGYDDGHHDGYMTCGEKWLSKIEDIKTYIHNYIIISEDEEKKLLGFIDRKVNEVKGDKE